MPEEDKNGYGCPPKAHQWKKGQSGNPKGRPKHTHNLKTDLESELYETLTITEGGKLKKVSKQRALIKSLMAKAIKGDSRSANTLLNMIFRILDIDPEKSETEDLTEKDALILGRFLKRNQPN